MRGKNVISPLLSFSRTPTDFVMKCKTTCGFILLFRYLSKNSKQENKYKMEGGREEVGIKFRCFKKKHVNARGVRSRREREVKINYFVKIPFHLTLRRRKVQLGPLHNFPPTSRRGPFSLFSSFLLLRSLFLSFPPLPPSSRKEEWQPFISH